MAPQITEMQKSTDDESMVDECADIRQEIAELKKMCNRIVLERGMSWKGNSQRYEKN